MGRWTMTQPMFSIYGTWIAEPDNESYTWVPEGNAMDTKESELYDRIMEVLYDVGLLEPVSVDSIAEDAAENYKAIADYSNGTMYFSRDDYNNLFHAVVADAITQALDAADCGDICACC